MIVSSGGLGRSCGPTSPRLAPPGLSSPRGVAVLLLLTSLRKWPKAWTADNNTFQPNTRWVTDGTASGTEPMPSYENPSSTALIILAITTETGPDVTSDPRSYRPLTAVYCSDFRICSRIDSMDEDLDIIRRQVPRLTIPGQRVQCTSSA